MLLSSVLAPPPSTPPPQSSSPPQNDSPPVEETSQSNSATTGSSEETPPSNTNQETTESDTSEGTRSQPDNNAAQNSAAQETAPDSSAPAVASSTAVDPTPQATESIALSNAVITPSAETRDDRKESIAPATTTRDSISAAESDLRDYAVAAVESRKIETGGGYTDQLFGSASLTDLLKTGAAEQAVQPRTVLTQAVEVYTTLQSYQGEEARAMDSV